MKRIILSLMLLTGLSAITAKAQMGEAQTIKWDVSKDVTLNISQDIAWEILNQPEMLVKASNGYVTSIVVTDAKFPVSRDVFFADGSKRSETIKQMEKEHKFMVIQLAEASLPKGVKEAEFAIFTKAKGDLSTISWTALIIGNAEGKKALMEQLKAEFESYAAGFDKMAKNSVPATPMN